MADKKDFTPQEYESIIEELRKENEALKKRISELENRDQVLKVKQEPLKEAPTPVAETETIEPVILVEDHIKKEEIIPIEQPKDIIVSESIFSQDVAPLEMGKGQILQGVSRRECPKCGNKSRDVKEKINFL